MGTLFLTNVPHNCNDTELKEWVECSGIEVKRVRLVRDLVAGVSPSFAYVEIQEKMTVAEAVSKLDGHKIRERVILVREARKSGRAA
jgi:RNA recognition motif-containing protein